MHRKYRDIFFLWGSVIILSFYHARAEVISSSHHIQDVTTVSLSSQGTVDIQIEPTKSQEASDTVVVVGAGAGGAAAAFKLPADTEDQSGVGVSSDPIAEKKLIDVAQPAPISGSDTVPGTVSPPPASTAHSGSEEPHKGQPGGAAGGASSSDSPGVPDQQQQQQQQQKQQPETGSSVPAQDPPGDLPQPSTGQQQTAVKEEEPQHHVVQPSAVPPSPAAAAGGESLENAGGQGGAGVAASGTPTSGMEIPQAGVPGQTGNSDPAQPKVEVDSSVPDLTIAAETIDPTNIGTIEKQSNLPVGVGGMAVEPEFTTGASSDGQDASRKEANIGSEGVDGTQSASPEGEGDFPTFDKWSVQYLAEQEKQKIEKEQEQAVKLGAQLSQKKLRQNFAAESCGAKVVSSNAEAENANFLLNGNPDEYMISPCKAKKWFVVELCEPVQIHKVELGTLELFSSPPKSFRVAASQRFPTKDWSPIGQFEMTPDRSVQSFHTQVSEEFVKFLRVEMLEHHGKEHYCPLTTLRVLGIDMALDDDEDHDTGDVEGHDAEQVDTADGMEGAVSLFNSAKETVVKLVKKVLYQGDKEEKAEEADNATKAAEEEKSSEQETTPCPIKDADQPTTGIPDPGTVAPTPDPAAQQGPPPPSPSSSSGEQEEAAVKQQPASTTETPIITKLADTEQLPMGETPVVVKLEPEEGDKSLGLGATGHSGLLTTTCPFSKLRPFFDTVSGLMDATPGPACYAERLSGKMRKVKTSKDARLKTLRQTEKPGEKPDSSGEPKDAPGKQLKQSSDQTAAQGVPLSETSTPQDTVAQPKSDAVNPGGPAATVQQNTPAVDSSGQVAPSEPGLGLKVDPQSSQPTEALASTLAPVSVEQPSATTPQASESRTTSPQEQQQQEQQQQTEPSLEPSSVLSTASLDQAGAAVSSVTSTPDLDIGHSQVMEQPTGPELSQTIFLKVDPSPTLSEGVSADHVDLMTDVPPTATTEPPVRDSLAGEESAVRGVGGGAAATGGGSDAKQDGSSRDQAATGTATAQPQPTPNVTEPVASRGRSGRAADLVKVGMPSSKRDASFMKLNNRIVALEQNVSMTKKYLEELSRAFKQQSEEMMKMINKTDGRIAGLIARTDEKDLEQSTAIAVLEQKVANLTQVVDLMQLKMDSMAEELWKGQMLLGFLQVLAFLWLFTNTATGAFTRVPVRATQPPPTDAVCSGDQRSSELPSSKGGVEPVGTVSGITGVPGTGLQQRRIFDTILPSHAEVHPTLGSGLTLPDRDSTIPSVSTPLDESSKEIFTQNTKKKKKKKQRQSQTLDSHGSLMSDSADTTPAQSPSFSSTAGVLFGTSHSGVTSSGLSVHQAAGLSDTAITTTAAAPPPPVTFGEAKENSPVGAHSPAFSVWPSVQGCQVCGDLRQGLPNAWPLRFPVARQPSLCQAHTVPTMTPWGHMQYPMGPALVPAMSTFSQGAIATSHPFLDLSNSPHRGAGVPLLQPSPSQPAESLQGTSPEFKLPAHRRSKIRRLSESDDTGSSGHSRPSVHRHHQISAARKTLALPESRRRKSDFINPNPWEEFFLAKNYLSENRFKFPASPPRDTISSETHKNDPLELGGSMHAPSPGANASGRDREDVSSQPLSGVSARPASPHTPDKVASTRFHPSTPSFIPLHQCPSVPSCTSSHLPPSPSFLSLRTNSQLDRLPSQGEYSRSTEEGRQNITSSHLPKQKDQSAASTNGSLGRSAASAVAGSKKPPPAPQKTHRRQGSYPLDQTNAHRHGSTFVTQNPQGPKPARPSSFGQSSSSQHQGGSKVKKASSNPGVSGHSKKGVGTKPAVSQGATNIASAGLDQQKKLPEASHLGV